MSWHHVAFLQLPYALSSHKHPASEQGALSEDEPGIPTSMNAENEWTRWTRIFLK